MELVEYILFYSMNSRTFQFVNLPNNMQRIVTDSLPMKTLVAFRQASKQTRNAQARKTTRVRLTKDDTYRIMLVILHSMRVEYSEYGSLVLLYRAIKPVLENVGALEAFQNAEGRFGYENGRFERFLINALTELPTPVFLQCVDSLRAELESRYIMLPQIQNIIKRNYFDKPKPLPAWWNLPNRPQEPPRRSPSIKTSPPKGNRIPNRNTVAMTYLSQNGKPTYYYGPVLGRKRTKSALRSFAAGKEMTAKKRKRSNTHKR
jgi:hypothetical protein